MIYTIASQDLSIELCIFNCCAYSYLLISSHCLHIKSFLLDLLRYFLRFLMSCGVFTCGYLGHHSRGIKVKHLLHHSSLFFAPGGLQGVLKLELFEYTAHQVWCQHWLRQGEGSVVPCNYHLGKFTTRKTFRGFRNLLNDLCCNSFHSNKFFSCVNASWMFPNKVKLFCG